MTRLEESPQAFRRINEVSLVIKETANTIRYWETKFPQIRPVKRPGGHRYYRRETINLLSGISYMTRKAGYTIDGVRRIIKEYGEAAVEQVGASQNLAPLSKAGVNANRPKSANGMPEETRALLLAAAAELREAARSLQA